jgi:hypothetical protein
MVTSVSSLRNISRSVARGKQRGLELTVDLYRQAATSKNPTFQPLFTVLITEVKKAVKELNRKLETQINGILIQSKRYRFRRFRDHIGDMLEKKGRIKRVDWERAAQLYAEAVEKFPPCFLLNLLDEMERILNPCLEIIPCESRNSEDDSCSKGLDAVTCEECPEYVAGSKRWANICKENPCPFWNEKDPCCDEGGKAVA